MKAKTNYFFVLLAFAICQPAQPQSSKRLSDVALMHEMRATPSPLNNAVVSDKNVSFMWPLSNHKSYYMENSPAWKKPKENDTNYRIRFSKDPSFNDKLFSASSSWPFYNPDNELSPGTWYWQFGYVRGDTTEWSDILQFEVKENPEKFIPPSYKSLMEKLPREHPRVLVFESEWTDFIQKSREKEEREWYIQKANEIINTERVNLDEAINTSFMEGLENEVKKKAMITRESRRIVDREEQNIDVLTRAYLLTKKRAYLDDAMKRIEEMVSWKNSPHLVGDFNQATLLSVTSLAYDSFYQMLTEKQKKMLLHEIKENGSDLFSDFANRLENHIADNHNWQMNFRIFTMAAFAVYGEIPEAGLWTEYAYNLWLARFPGLNKDGAWHNGDSYFHTNIRTLVEVPYFYTKVTGYDFFRDPWYKGSAMYVIFQQPPFSKSGGNGSSHQNVTTPRGTRVAYADALARLTNNSFLSDYVEVISESEPDIMKQSFGSKPGDLSWFRVHCNTPLPKGDKLAGLPLSYVFPQTGLASFMSDWKDLNRNAMFTFRSSPYGSTSHALANQNAFNTFYGGKALFYSTGHHSSFIDAHSFFSHRSTRAHNTILINGMGQKIGTEGYGWIPRYYEGTKISYVTGDASNAYGEVISPIWKERAEKSGLSLSPENGWGKNHLLTYRRHIVKLGDAGLVFIYDELEADTLVHWNYLLHTIENPMTIVQKEHAIQIRATNEKGTSDAYLFSNDELEVEMTNKFFTPALNWLKANNEGYFEPYKNHWHFEATTPMRKIYRFATIINTHDRKEQGIVPEHISDTEIRAGNWSITFNLSPRGKASFSIDNRTDDIKLIYDDITTIQENGITTILKDELPELEI